MSLRLAFPLFIKEAILFSLALGIGLYTAYYYSFYFGSLIQNAPTRFTFNDFVILLVFFGAIFLISRHRKFASFSLNFFLVLVVFSGTQVILGTFISSPQNLLTAVFLTLVFILGRNVLMHNLGIILGTSGVAAVFGLSVSPEVGLILLIALSFYDILAVYVTKHMVALARGMVRSGAVFGFLVPLEFKGFFYNKNQARAEIGQSFMILGSGDIGLPIIFASSLAKTSLESAVITALFSLLGLFITHILFVNQGQRRAMAALPPIATLTIIGYLVSQLWLK